MEGKSRRTAPWTARFDGFVKQSEPKKHNSYKYLDSVALAHARCISVLWVRPVSTTIKKHRINAMLSGWAVFN